MDPQSSYNDLPWELIVPALQGELSPEEELRFQEWLASSGNNREQYDRVQRMWKEGMGDYMLYKGADEGKAWEALREKMGDGGEKMGDRGQRKGVVYMRRWTVAAAVLLLAAGAGWWYMAGKTASVQYRTVVGEQRTVSLPDGSTVVLSGQTRIELDHDYNKTSRTVTLVSGNAQFDVVHQEQRPFTVDLGIVSIKDIGTSFTVDKTKDSIKVTVSAGKIAFIEKESGQSREVSVGGSLCFYTAGRRYSTTDLLRFDNAPLSDVITALQRLSGKNILLKDPSIGQKKLTAHLAGESFEDALKTVCASLNLVYDVKNGAYILEARDTATHN
ncbi:MAG: FecR domain-containing protein [Chitinophagaceae bacterium]|nr:FecR domain-containing protein [Chitinophagaceae bacterium]